MKRFSAAVAALLALFDAAPALAQTKALPPGEIRPNGDITFGNALKLGKREGNKTVITPDTLQILGPGSTGDATMMSVRPRDALAPLPLKQIAESIVLNVAWFVQPGDNGDWALACQRAVNAALALPRGGEVHHSRGEFIYKSQCRIPKVYNKGISFTGEGAGKTILFDNGQQQHIIWTGSEENAQGERVTFRNFTIQGVDNPRSRGIYLKWANGAIFENMQARDLFEAVTSENSYGVTFSKCHDLYIQGAFFHSLTAAHKTVLNDHASNESPGVLLKIDAASDAISINDIDFEGSGQMVKMPGGTNLRIKGGYLEYMRQNIFDFTGGTMVNANIDLDWFALGQGAGTTQVFANMKNGTLKMGTMYNQAISFDESTIYGLDVKDRYFNPIGTSVITGMPTRWRVPTLSASWAQRPNYTKVRYRRDENDEVFMEGELTNGTEGSVIFTLPARFRPSDFMSFTTQTANGTAWVTIAPDGKVTATTTPGGLFSSLNGIRFTAPQN